MATARPLSARHGRSCFPLFNRAASTHSASRLSQPQQSGLVRKASSASSPLPWTVCCTRFVLQLTGSPRPIRQDADRILSKIQCSAVQFVAGKGTPTSACTNTTGVSGSFVSDPSLTALVAQADACPVGASGAPSPTSSSGPAPSQSKSAAPGSPALGGMAVLSTAAMALAMALLGAAYMA